MLAADLIERVADGVEKILIGGDDGTVELKLDDGLRLVDGGRLALKIQQSLRGVSVYGRLAKYHVKGLLCRCNNIRGGGAVAAEKRLIYRHDASVS